MSLDVIIILRRKSIIVVLDFRIIFVVALIDNLIFNLFLFLVNVIIHLLFHFFLRLRGDRRTVRFLLLEFLLVLKRTTVGREERLSTEIFRRDSSQFN